MNARATTLQTSTVQQYCKTLRLPAMATQAAPLAEQAERARES